MIHLITLAFYGEYNGNISILILCHQEGLERRDGHPGGVQQDKLMFHSICHKEIGYDIDTSIMET